MEGQDDYLTLSEAAEYLGISRVTVWRRVRDGTLTPYQTASSRHKKLVKRKDLDRLLRPRKLSSLR